MSGSIEKPRIAWDSCIFLAWFNKEEDKKLHDVELILQDIDSGKNVLLVSVVCCAEVLDRAGESTAGTQFREFVKRSNVIVANVDWRIAERAAVFRHR